MNKIIGVAIMSGGIVYWMRRGRHGLLGHAMIENGHPIPYPGGPAQGFILDDEMTFVNRTQAADIALGNGQCKNIRAEFLFSEDLW